jgi:hypothetical protein
VQVLQGKVITAARAAQLTWLVVAVAALALLVTLRRVLTAVPVARVQLLA